MFVFFLQTKRISLTFNSMTPPLFISLLLKAKMIYHAFFFFKIMLKFMLLRVAEYFEISASLLHRVQKTIFPS